MADTTTQSFKSTDPAPTGKKRNRTTPKSRNTDLEKDRREIEPVAPVLSSKKAPERINVGRQERFLSLIGGAGLIAYGVTRRDWAGIGFALAGAGLALRGATGHCSVYGAMRSILRPATAVKPRAFMSNRLLRSTSLRRVSTGSGVTLRTRRLSRTMSPPSRLQARRQAIG